MQCSRVLLGAVVCVGALACVSGGDDAASTASESESGEGSETEASETSEGEVIDAQAVVEAALAYATYEPINAASPSQHGLADTVVVWVPEGNAADYRAIDPDDPEASAAFEPGTLFVKEHLDAEGEPAGMTLMFKGPPGYDPEHGDWWWANASLDGTLNDEGAVGYCIACHTPRAGADWVFGIPLDEQL